MDFGLAVLTFETAGMLIGMLLLRGLVGSPTFGAGEYYCGLRSAAHLRSMLPDARGEQCCRRQVGMQPIIVLASARLVGSPRALGCVKVIEFVFTASSRNNQNSHTRSGPLRRSRRNRILPPSLCESASVSPHEPGCIADRQKSPLSWFG